MKVISVSATTTPNISDDIILVDTSGGDVSIHLPLSSKDKSFIIKKIDPSYNSVLIDSSIGETIEFNSFYEINTFLSAIKTVYNGTQWLNV